MTVNVGGDAGVDENVVLARVVVDEVSVQDEDVMAGM
jgi:hypothetical protein